MTIAGWIESKSSSSNWRSHKQTRRASNSVNVHRGLPSPPSDCASPIELATYRAQHPSSSAPAPSDSDFPSAVESTSKRPTPDSPPRKHPKKKRKQGDSNPSTGSSKLGAEELDFAIQRLQSGECCIVHPVQVLPLSMTISL